jgi:hypothetical protein
MYQMKFTFLKSALKGLVLCCASLTANAEVITIGSLTLQSANDKYVTDSLNGFDWLRWDQVNTLNFAQLQKEIVTGGTYEGWSIAKTEQAGLFHEAIWGLGSLPLDYLTVSFTKDILPHGTALEFVELMGRQPNSITSQGWFLDDDVDLKQVISEGDYGDFGVSYLRVNFDTTNWRYNDSFFKAPATASYTINNTELAASKGKGFVLYRQSIAVPEPYTLAIIALGMIGLASRRFKKQS